MNFLGLAQALRREAGISGAGPSTVLSQSGEPERVVKWVRDAWVDIQSLRQDWLWQNAEVDVTLQTTIIVELSGTTPAITDLAEWDVHSLRLSTPAMNRADEMQLVFEPWKTFRDLYDFGVRPTARPTIFTIRPDARLMFDTIPDKVYRLRGDYRRTAQWMTADTDIPRAPEDHHMAIVWYALMRYAGFEETGSTYASAQANFRRAYAALVNDRRSTPRIQFGEALA